MQEELNERGSLTKSETIKAWKEEVLEGKTRVAAARHAFVSERTLTRMYRKYNLPSPKRGKERWELLEKLYKDD